MIPTNPHTTYTSPKGRKYRLIGLSNKKERNKYLWNARIKFLDDGSNADIFFGYNEKLIKIDLNV